MPLIKKNSVLHRTLGLLSKEDQRKTFLLLLAQITVSFLDLIGVVLVGIVGALAVTGVESRSQSGRILTVLKMISLSNLNFRSQIVILATFAGCFLVLRSFISAYLSRRIYLFLAFRGATLSGELIEKLFSRNLLFIRNRTEKETIYALTVGVEDISIKILGTFAAGISDLSLLIFLAVGLLVIQPLVALSAFIFFLILALILQRFVTSKMRELGESNTRYTLETVESLSITLSSYRELLVRNQLPFAIAGINKSRKRLAKVLADLAFMPSIGKYVIETGVVLGALFLSGFQFLLSNAVHAVSTLAIFLTAGARIAPALLRVQNGIGIYRSSIGPATTTLELAEELAKLENQMPSSITKYATSHNGFNALIEISNMSLSYPQSTNLALSEISFNIMPGEWLAIVGPSGAGKTSLIDVVLGVIDPTSGFVKISNESPRGASFKWPGAIAYVPQEPNVMNGSIKENILFGYDEDEVSDESIWNALEMAELTKVVKEFPNGIHSIVGEKGIKLSGGQRQRLAIARALITSPKILVFDEATSSLDVDTEKLIINTISKLKGDVTILMIAHRLATIRDADRLVYLENGKVVAIDSFENLRAKVANFDSQAISSGL